MTAVTTSTASIVASARRTVFVRLIDRDPRFSPGRTVTVQYQPLADKEE
jgi:hypothetical protein